MMKGREGHPASGETLVDLGFGGLSAAAGDHIGHFYRNENEITQLLVPHYAAGLQAGDKCTLFAQSATGEMVLEGLKAQGVEIEKALSSGQFVLYEGLNSVEAAMEVFSSLIDETRKAGYRLIRHAGDMAWGLTNMPSTDELVKWEAMYDLHVASQFSLVALCQYDLRAFGGDVVLDALKTHPLCVVGETVHKNPFYTSPRSSWRN